MNATPTSQRLLWFSMIFGTVIGGIAFCYKIAEFMFALTSAEARGFADVPITVYFVVSAGWLCLLAWCFLTGQFHRHEAAKYDMLAQEEQYERAGL